LLFLAVFSSSIYAIGKKNKVIYLMILSLVTLDMIFRISQKFYPTIFVIISSILLSALTLILITLIILIHVLKDKKISINEIYGAICVYLLLGTIWGLFYFLIAYLNPSAIVSPTPITNHESQMTQSLYFSFITLTSTGYGDIYPVTSMARVVAYLEAIVGQLYLVVLIGWMVGALAHRNK
jgi:voltage-gated potassium channel